MEIRFIILEIILQRRLRKAIDKVYNVLVFKLFIENECSKTHLKRYERGGKKINNFIKRWRRNPRCSIGN